jgi:hypothetical protein
LLSWALLFLLLGLLALVAALLPRFLTRREGRPLVETLSLRDLSPPAGLPAGQVPKPALVPEVAAPEDPLLAAAVALALDLYLKEGQAGSEGATAAAWGAEAASPWGLSGRWLAMQRRLYVRKR